jgi:hypothetical protein
MIKCKYIFFIFYKQIKVPKCVCIFYIYYC